MTPNRTKPRKLRAGCGLRRWHWSAAILLATASLNAEDLPKPYSQPCTERENLFEFAERPKVTVLGEDRYEIAFSVKGYCDVTVGIIDQNGVPVRHLASGVLGGNAPLPFQKNSLKQALVWNGKDDLDEYPKEPLKMRARVMLGLKPEFDKRLGGCSPKNLPGRILGLCADPGGVTVFSVAHSTRVFVRRFDLDGHYLRTLSPPPAHLPPAGLQGLGWVEYEPGRRALHSVDVNVTCSDNLNFLPYSGSRIAESMPAVVGQRIYYLNSANPGDSILYALGLDGTVEAEGAQGRPFSPNKLHFAPQLAAAPGGRYLYMANDGPSGAERHHVYRFDLKGSKKAEVFLGDGDAPGSDPGHFNNPCALDCDAQGRLYVCDRLNSRLQVFSPEGRHLKAIPVDRPSQVQVHKREGSIYVQHAARVAGKSITRVTKFGSWEDPRELHHQEGLFGLMVLDSWSKKPRLWLSGMRSTTFHANSNSTGRNILTVWEEDAQGWRLVRDFEMEAGKEDAQAYAGRWGGGAMGVKTVCDPVRETVYFGNRNGQVFNLKSGVFLGRYRVNAYAWDDIAFDKRGYMHCHFNPGKYLPGVGRVDPGRPETTRVEAQDGPSAYTIQGIQDIDTDDGLEAHSVFTYPEVPYDYGIEATGKYRTEWRGILPVKDQPGPNYFQLGIGVNPRGELAVESQIYYVPRMDEVGDVSYFSGPAGRKANGEQVASGVPDYATFLRQIQEREKMGEQTYYLKRRAGIPLAGSTIWTYDRTGELREECAAISGQEINGVQIDEQGNLYFVTARPRMTGPNAYYLQGRGGNFGAAPNTQNRSHPFTGTLMKTRGKQVEVLLAHAPVPLDPLPSRPPDLAEVDFVNSPFGPQNFAWVEGAEWFYAGASPIISHSCRCPQLRFHTDWYKRTFVPEAYRHSVGVVDTAGNLILHFGQYGNFDSGNGPASAIPVEGGIAFCGLRFLSGTDNYLAFEDYAERFATLKLNYHAEETVPVQSK